MGSKFTITASDNVILHATRFDPRLPAKGLIVVVHGLGEHSGRYIRPALELAENGFAVVTYDQRAHGQTAKKLGVIEGGFPKMVEDVDLVRAKAQELYPNLPTLILAHSMGSFVTQKYLLSYSYAPNLKGVALSGSAAMDLRKKDAASRPSGFRSNNYLFEPGRTGFEWLTRDENEVDKQQADPLCGFTFDAQGYADYYSISDSVSSLDELSKINPDLKIYAFSGTMDPVGGPNGSFVDVLVERYRKAGVKDVEIKLYEGARHEMLNETNREEAMRDLVELAERAVKA